MNTHDPASREHANPWVFGTALVIGWCVIAYGLWTMFHNDALTNPTYSFEFAFGANLVHDAILAPVAFVVGYIIRRIAPLWLRGPVMWGLYATAVILLVAYVPLRGFGKRADNPSLLPLDYTTGTITVLTVVWLIAIGAAAIRFLRRRRGKS